MGHFCRYRLSVICRLIASTCVPSSQLDLIRVGRNSVIIVKWIGNTCANLVHRMYQGRKKIGTAVPAVLRKVSAQ